MSLLWFEGFEGFTASNLEAHLIRKYPAATTSTIQNESIQSGRYSGSSLRMAASGTDCSLITPSFTGTSSIYMGVAIKIPATPFSATLILGAWDGASAHMNIVLDTSRRIVFRRHTTTIATSTFRLRRNRWYFIEMGGIIHNSTGSYTVKVDGVTVLSGSGIDTADGASVVCTYGMLRWPRQAATADGALLDDWYICNGAGTVNNTFLGDKRVILLTPSGNDAVQFTPSAGSNYEAVDEIPSDDDTTYVESSTIGHKDTYDFTNQSELTDIVGVQLSATAKVPSGTETLKLVTKSNGVESVSTGNALTTAYTTKSVIVEQDPDGSVDWTQAKLDAAKFGLEVG